MVNYSDLFSALLELEACVFSKTVTLLKCLGSPSSLRTWALVFLSAFLYASGWLQLTVDFRDVGI